MKMSDTPNTPKINRQVAALRQLRAAGEMRVGWNPGEMEPTTANALVKAGLAEFRGVRPDRTIVPKEQT